MAACVVIGRDFKIDDKELALVNDSKKLTAAHPTLPLGTRVKVVNLANDRSVIVTINDRFRKRKYDVIDLSRAAASELGFIRRGTAKVRISPVDE